MAATAPGSSIVFTVQRNGREKTITVVTAKNMTRSFDIGYISDPTVLQKAILDDLFRQVD